MANGDIVSATILASGWEIEIEITSDGTMSTGGTYRFDTPNLASPSGFDSRKALTEKSSAYCQFTIDRPGYDATGATITNSAEVIYGTIAKRKAYPSQTTMDE